MLCPILSTLEVRMFHIVFTRKKINLGLDLKGGSYLLLQADMKIVFEEKLEGLLSDIRYSLRKSKIGYKKLVAKRWRYFF